MIQRLLPTASIFIALSILAITTGCKRSPDAVSVGKVDSGPGLTAPKIATVTVESREISRQLRLPGELAAWQEATLSPRVSGYVRQISVDRGSTVRAGQVLAVLDAPEIAAQRSAAELKTTEAGDRKNEAEAHARSLQAQRLEAEARLSAATSTWQRLRSAAATPGVIAGNELEIAQSRAEAEGARVKAFRENEEAARLHANSLALAEKAAKAMELSAKATEHYLQIVAPYPGTITARFAHPGSLASPDQPMLQLQQLSKLRLIVNLPEAEVPTVRRGLTVSFSVPAYPGRTFSAQVTRPADALDPRTRTMPVELDVNNESRELSPGMFPLINWPAEKPTASLLVPLTSVAVTTERTFVIRIKGREVEWVNVRKGLSVNLNGRDLVEVFGDLSPGDTVAIRGTDELRPGTTIGN
ncbi:MAG: efflux RND transporter periplasmic adaptor subunit [Acidobacteria bacterium]|nr:efflux RND transporter periplasmic adaptor subunit [Acidobacteriota bacterium]